MDNQDHTMELVVQNLMQISLSDTQEDGVALKDVSVGAKKDRSVVAIRDGSVDGSVGASMDVTVDGSMGEVMEGVVAAIMALSGGASGDGSVDGLVDASVDGLVDASVDGSMDGLVGASGGGSVGASADGSVDGTSASTIMAFAYKLPEDDLLVQAYEETATFKCLKCSEVVMAKCMVMCQCGYFICQECFLAGCWCTEKKPKSGKKGKGKNKTPVFSYVDVGSTSQEIDLDGTTFELECVFKNPTGK